MTEQEHRFSARLASGPDDVRIAQALRYRVFVAELGADGAGVDHAAGLEADAFDAHADHLLLEDLGRSDRPVVGVYRLMDADAARAAGQFYSEDEYDLAPLRATGRSLLELGRSCLHPDYRGGPAMMHLWQALGEYVAERDIALLFGTASFHGTDIAALAQPLANLHHRHRAPPELCVRARQYQTMDLVPEDALDRRRAVLETPALIKAYLRLGGVVGDGAFVDHAFNTTDVCLILDTARMPARGRGLYAGGAA